LFAELRSEHEKVENFEIAANHLKPSHVVKNGFDAIISEIYTGFDDSFDDFEIFGIRRDSRSHCVP